MSIVKLLRVNVLQHVGLSWTGLIFFVVLAGLGCQRNPGGGEAEDAVSGSVSTRPVKSTSTDTPTTGQAAEVRPEGVDARDEPGAPRAIPHSHQLIDWVKIHPVRVRGPEEVTDIVEDERIIGLSRLFPLNRVARTVYRKQDTLADVIYIEAQTPMDAYGFYSVATTTQGVFNRADGSVRTDEPLEGPESVAGRLLAAWQGDACVFVRCLPAEEKESASLASCDPVLSKIVFEIPSQDPPLLLFAVPMEYRERSNFWCVRTTRALPTEAHPVIAEIDPEVMDRRLGLNGHVLLHLASVGVDEDEPDNLIWVAEYADSQAAAEAYARYVKAIEANGMELDTHTLLIQPDDRLMAGSWTAGQESIQRLLPRLREMLKSD